MCREILIITIAVVHLPRHETLDMEKNISQFYESLKCYGHVVEILFYAFIFDIWFRKMGLCEMSSGFDIFDCK